MLPVCVPESSGGVHVHFRTGLNELGGAGGLVQTGALPFGLPAATWQRSTAASSVAASLVVKTIFPPPSPDVVLPPPSVAPTPPLEEPAPGCEWDDALPQWTAPQSPRLRSERDARRRFIGTPGRKEGEDPVAAFYARSWQDLP
jgi:hypothetical protein